MAVKFLSFFDEKVFIESRKLLMEARDLCYSRVHPDESIVLIELEKGKADTLTRLCAKMDQSARPAIESMLQKAQKKLALAEKVNQYLREEENNKSIDPRVEKLMAKLTQLSGNPPNAASAADFEKLLKWREKLNKIGQRAGNPMTVETLNKASKTIRDLDMELLKKSPYCVCMGDSVLSEEARQYYDKLPDPEKSQRQSSVAFALIYLDTILRCDDLRTNGFQLGAGTNEGRHERMAQLIEEKKPEWRISDENVREGFSDQYLEAVASPEISYLPGANQQEIQLKLQALIDLKNANRLKSMGAFVGIGYQTVAIVFHNTGRISLLNPCGDEKREFSYEANFGSVEQVAEFLKKMTDEEEFHEIPPITFKPYYHGFALVQEKLAEIKAADAFSAGRPTFSPSFETNPSSMAYSTGPYVPFVSSTLSALSESFPQLSSMLGTPFPSFSGSVFLNPIVPPEFEISFESSPSSEYPEEDNGALEKFSLIEMFPGMAAIKESIQALSQRNKEGFYQSILHLDKLKEDNWSWTDGDSCTTPDRVYFHLYRIQDQETPEKIDRNDNTWGKKAFQTEALSTPEQRLRAVQRVRLEQLLLSLALVIRVNHGTENFLELLDELEQMKLNPSDLPNGQTNAAHALFEKFSQVFAKTREDSSRDVPNDDFGRWGFRDCFENKACDGIRIEALQELAKDLKAAWRI